jgi:hypothetical protein
MRTYVRRGGEEERNGEENEWEEQQMIRKPSFHTHTHTHTHTDKKARSRLFESEIDTN